MSVEENKAIARRWFGAKPPPEIIRQLRDGKDPRAAIEKKTRSGVEEIFASDCVVHYPEGDGNRERVIQVNISLLTAFPDASFAIDKMLAEGDLVAILGTWQGTNLGSYNEMPATGKKVEMGYMAMCRVAGGKIVESWGYGDSLSLM